MGPGTDVVSTQTFKAGEGVVGNEKTTGQAVSTNARKVKNVLNWSEIFEEHPELYPPGYNEAVEATMLKLEQRRMAAKEKAAKPPIPSKSTRKRKR